MCVDLMAGYRAGITPSNFCFSTHKIISRRRKQVSSWLSRLTLIVESMILIILVALPGVWSGSWSVVSKDQCALKGTSVLIQCEYDYPYAHIVTKVEWNKRLQISGQPRLVPLYQILSAPGHFRYVGDKWSDCSLRIDNVQNSDEGLYFFHFKTTLDAWRSTNPASLTVTELTAVVHPSTVTEGDKVTLTYVSDCLTPVDVVWFRDGQRVSEQVFQARREDAGRYHCAFLGQDTARSTSVTLNVWYSPRKVMLSVSSSSEVIVKGSSVTFTCSSEANPPVTQSGYSLYKDGHYIGTGDTYTISDVQPSHSGLYHCQAWNNISRTGVNFLNSTEVHLDVQYPPVNIIVSLNPPRVTEGSGMNLTCSSSANPAVENYTWFRRITNSCSGSSSLLQVGSGQVLSLLSVEESHTGLYLCQARNTLGGNNSTEVLLTIRGELHGDQSILVSAGVGVFLLVTLLFAAMLFWRKKMTYAKKKMSPSDQIGFDLNVSGRSLSLSVAEDPNNSVYVNISALPSARPPVTDQDISPHSKTESRSKHHAQTSQEDDITYSTVNIKSRNPDPAQFKNANRAAKDSRSRTGENENSVIYSTLSKSS